MTIIELGLGAAFAAIVIVAVGAAAQVVTGFGFSLVVVPVFVLLIGPSHAVRLANLLAAVVNAAILVREHRSARLSMAARLLLPAAIVTPLAAYVVHRTRAPVLSIVVGLVIIACALTLASGLRSARLHGAGALVGVGAVSALMNTASGVGGPAVAMYAVNAGWPIETMRPTLQVYFLGLNAVTYVALGPVAVRPAPAFALVGAIAAGSFLGVLVGRRLRAEAVERSILVLAMAGGIAAVIRGVIGG